MSQPSGLSILNIRVLWHGHVRNALKAIGVLQAECLDAIPSDARYGRLSEMLAESRKYIENNADFIPTMPNVTATAS